jgi:hypothetical protein
MDALLERLLVEGGKEKYSKTVRRNRPLSTRPIGHSQLPRIM